VATVAVVAAEAWWAEALATALCVSPAPAALGARGDASVLVVRADGTRITTPELEGALR
jgi:thiamine biosynthesis lipoprotein ApbE